MRRYRVTEGQLLRCKITGVVSKVLDVRRHIVYLECNDQSRVELPLDTVIENLTPISRNEKGNRYGRGDRRVRRQQKAA
jgi:hypothetical protein